MSINRVATVLFTIHVLFFASSPAHANPVGAGVILFGPTGVSGNYFLKRNRNIDAALAWSLDDDDQNFYIHSTYIWRQPKLLTLDKTKLDTYFGVGGRLISWEDPPGKEKDSEMHLGVRGSGGVSYFFKKPLIELFGELSLTMDIVPETDADLDIGLGARFYF